MLRGLVKLILLVVIVVAVAAFFIGYRWAGPDAVTDREPARPTTGTTGAAAETRERAREVGAEIGDTVAAGANAAERALANGQLTAKIKSKMALDDSVRARSIDVDTSNGVVTLSGTVGSEAQRQRAVQLARETDGVKSVVDRLKVQ
jgi:BON domain-containing protein